MGRIILCCLLALGLPLSVQASEFREAAAPKYFSEQAGVNLEVATAIVRRKTGGRHPEGKRPRVRTTARPPR